MFRRVHGGGRACFFLQRLDFLYERVGHRVASQIGVKRLDDLVEPAQLGRRGEHHLSAVLAELLSLCIVALPG